MAQKPKQPDVGNPTIVREREGGLAVKEQPRVDRPPRFKGSP